MYFDVFSFILKLMNEYVSNKIKLLWRNIFVDIHTSLMFQILFFFFAPLL